MVLDSLCSLSPLYLKLDFGPSGRIMHYLIIIIVTIMSIIRVDHGLVM